LEENTYITWSFTVEYGISQYQGISSIFCNMTRVKKRVNKKDIRAAFMTRISVKYRVTPIERA
jgi:hypothetical protein